MRTTKTILAAVLMMVAVGCDGGEPVEVTAEPVVVGGQWAVAFGDASICFGTMELAQSGDSLRGVWTCGVSGGDVVGTVSGRDVLLTLSGGPATMPVTATVSVDGQRIAGFIDYPFGQEHSEFAARRASDL